MIKKIHGLFKSNQSFCYSEDHQKSENFLDLVMQSMYDNGRKYWYVLNALRLHGGSLNQNFLRCYSSYPIKPLKSHKPFEKVMQIFVNQNLIVFNENYYSLSPKLFNSSRSLFLANTFEVIKDTILKDFNSVVKNTGMISFESGKMHDEFGKFQWGFKGASMITALKKGTKAGFVVADM